MLQTIKLLLPALIPSWRFFDTIAPSPRIEFTLLQSVQGVAGDWQEFRPRPSSLAVHEMLVRMFWNPRWNETLFLVSCAERLLTAPTEHSSHEIFNRINRELNHASIDLAATPYLQFRLAVVVRNGEALEKSIEFVSPAYKLAASARS